MRRIAVMVATLTLLGVGLTRAQEDSQAAARRDLQQKMRELEEQMRQNQREMADLQRELQRMSPGRTWVGSGESPIFSVIAGHAYLGVNVMTDKSPATDSIGALLITVTPGGPADQAGLRGGDIITKFNNESLAGPYPAADRYQSAPGIKLRDLAYKLDDGDSVKVEYRSGKATRTATIIARDLGTSFGYAFTVPSELRVRTAPIVEGVLNAMPVLAGAGPWSDMELVAMNPELGAYFGTDEGLLVIRAPSDSGLNLRTGDVILKVDGRAPRSQAQLLRILRSYGPDEEITMDIMRQKKRTTVTGTMPDARYRYRYERNR